MPLFGTLKTMALPDLLQWLATARMTGTLQIERNKVGKSILMREGEVVGCSSDDPPDAAGTFPARARQDHGRAVAPGPGDAGNRAQAPRNDPRRYGSAVAGRTVRASRGQGRGDDLQSVRLAGCRVPVPAGPDRRGEHIPREPPRGRRAAQGPQAVRRGAADPGRVRRSWHRARPHGQGPSAGGLRESYGAHGLRYDRRRADRGRDPAPRPRLGVHRHQVPVRAAPERFRGDRRRTARPLVGGRAPGAGRGPDGIVDPAAGRRRPGGPGGVPVSRRALLRRCRRGRRAVADATARRRRGSRVVGAGGHRRSRGSSSTRRRRAPPAATTRPDAPRAGTQPDDAGRSSIPRSICSTGCTASVRWTTRSAD